MKKTFLRLAALALLLTLAYSSEGQVNRRSVARSTMPTLARNIKVYTFNGPSSRKAVGNSKADSCSKKLGSVTFKNPDTSWTVGTQIWSDVVMATGCKKDDFEGGYAMSSQFQTSYEVDCRQNTGYGDLFSWEMVNTCKDQLCPDGWHVPTMDNFITLDIALGGTGEPQGNVALHDKYVSEWGSSYGGQCDRSGLMQFQEEFADYWSQSDSENRRSGCLLSVNYRGGGVGITCDLNKGHGFQLRCVK